MPRAGDDQSESAVETNVAIIRCAGTFCRQQNDSKTTVFRQIDNWYDPTR